MSREIFLIMSHTPTQNTGQGISLNGKVPFEILPEKRIIT